MQNPTPLITSGRSRNDCSKTNVAHSSMRGSALSSANASMTAAGSVHNEPWLVSGVTVATSGSAAASASRSSQPSVTAVSELSTTTSPARVPHARG